MFIWVQFSLLVELAKKKKNLNSCFKNKNKKAFQFLFLFFVDPFFVSIVYLFVTSDADRARSESSTHNERPESVDRSAEVNRRLERLEEMLARFSSEMADKGEKTKGKKKKKRAATESEESDLSESSAVDSESDSDDGWRTVKRKEKAKDRSEGG